MWYNISAKIFNYICKSGIALVILANVSCATLYGQNTREITITSEPTGADVYMHGVLFGKTPAQLMLTNPGINGQLIDVIKPGYYDKLFIVKTEVQPVVYWDLLFPPGFLIDLGSGCLFRLPQNEYNVVLMKIESSSLTESQI